MKFKIFSAISIMTFAVGHASASGYNFGSQSVSSQGSAHANAAEANDASTIYYNPAGLARLKGGLFSVGVTAVVPDSSYSDTGSTTVMGTSPGGNNGGNYAPSVVWAPSLYLSHSVGERINIGVGIYIPYGAKLDYDDDWVGRFALQNIDLKTVAINPSISLRLTEQHSVGLGVTAQYMDAKLQKAVDVKDGLLLGGQERIATGQPGGPQLVGLSNLVTNNGTANMSANGWGVGVNVGYLFELDEFTRFGLAYRSEIHQTLKGQATWHYDNLSQNATAAAAAATAARHQHDNSNATTQIVTPQSVSAHFYRDLTSKLALMGNVTWTGHSTMKSIDIKFTDTAEPEGDLVIQQNWKNSWLFALGANYRHNDRLLLRTGLAYDQSPIPNDTLRHPALPDSNRYWVSLGAHYAFTKNASVDFAYSYVFFDSAKVDYTDSCKPHLTTCTGNGETTKGQYKTHMQFIALQYNQRF